MRSVFVLLIAGCSFETGAVDQYLGPDCGHFEADRMTLGNESPCWRDAGDLEECFLSSDGPCEPRRPKTFPAGSEVAIWCPVGTVRHDEIRLVGVECE